MADNTSKTSTDEYEEQYVVLDLSGLSEQLDISPNAPYVLSGLDTLNPTLVIDEKLKLIGEYEETIGTCLVFSEHGATRDPSQPEKKPAKPVAILHKVLKFRLCDEEDNAKDHGRGVDR